VWRAALRICIQLIGECVDFNLAFLNDNVFLLEGDILSCLLAGGTI
jgi:hypothetical protein